jgi:hypothetical protein
MRGFETVWWDVKGDSKDTKESSTDAGQLKIEVKLSLGFHVLG